MSDTTNLPIIPLRGAVLLPGISMPIGAGRPGTLRAIETALKGDKTVFALAQRENQEAVSPDILYTIGTIAKIAEIQRGPSGVQLLLQGERRGIAMRIGEHDGYLEATVREVEEMLP